MKKNGIKKIILKKNEPALFDKPIKKVLFELIFELFR